MYITQEDIVKALPDNKLVELTSEVNGSMDYDSEKILSSIDYAEAIVNDYLRYAYDIPVTASPTIQEICIMLATYRLYQYRHRVAIPEEIKNGYDRALSLLGSYQKGEMLLEDIRKATPITVRSRSQVFTNDFLSRL